MILAADTMFDISTVALGVVVLVTIAGLVGFGWLIQQLGTIKQFIRETAGVTESQTTSISGQPISIHMAERYTTRGSFETHARLNREHHEKIEARVSALERKLEDDKDEIIKAGEDRAVKLHERINVAIEKIGELRGEVTQIAKHL